MRGKIFKIYIMHESFPTMNAIPRQIMIHVTEVHMGLWSTWNEGYSVNSQWLPVGWPLSYIFGHLRWL